MVTRMQTTLVAVRLPAPMIQKLDQFAREKCATRAEAIRRLLEEPLEQIELKQREAKAA
jgi:metal-responsive CopG/Arc/MetJ family transcriptional regulator